MHEYIIAMHLQVLSVYILPPSVEYSSFVLFLLLLHPIHAGAAPVCCEWLGNRTCTSPSLLFACLSLSVLHTQFHAQQEGRHRTQHIHNIHALPGIVRRYKGPGRGWEEGRVHTLLAWSHWLSRPCSSLDLSESLLMHPSNRDTRTPAPLRHDHECQTRHV